MNVLAFDSVRLARERIAPFVRRTPLVRSDWLSRVVDGDVFLKLESLQVTNSFKARGAMNAVLAMVEHGKRHPCAKLVTASAGNHGRAMAWAARQIGIPLVVYTPKNAPAAKLEPIRGAGVELRAVADTYEESELLAKRCAIETGATFVSAYSHPDLIAAIGTIALEIVEDLPDVDRVVVPVGGGGLLAGIAAALTIVRPQAQTIGVEVEASRPFAFSLAAGRIVQVEVKPTLADGLAGNMDPENIAFPIVRALVERLTMVNEPELEAGLRGLVGHEHLIAEGAGAVGVAAMLAGRIDAQEKKTAVIVSGSNIDTTVLNDILGRN
jgi:threonine dehydratase